MPSGGSGEGSLTIERKCGSNDHACLRTTCCLHEGAFLLASLASMSLLFRLGYIPRWPPNKANCKLTFIHLQFALFLPCICLSSYDCMHKAGKREVCISFLPSQVNHTHAPSLTMISARDILFLCYGRPAGRLFSYQAT